MPTQTQAPESEPAKKSSRTRIPAAQRALAAFAPELKEFTGNKVPSPGDAVMVPLELVEVSEKHTPLRYTNEELEGLASSIREDGLHLPIVVTPHGPKYELIDGRHRLEAHRRLGETKIAANIRFDLQGADVDVARAVINLQRKALPPYHEAAQMRRVLGAHSWSPEEAAPHLGVAANTIRNRLRLLELPEDLGKRVGEPGFSAQHAEILVPLAKHPDHLKAAAAVVGATDHSGRPLDVAAFAHRVRRHLVDKGLAVPADGRYEVTWQVRERKSFKNRLKGLPTVKIGLGRDAESIITDRKAYDVAEKSELADWDAEQTRIRAKKTGKKSPADREREKKEALKRKQEREIEAAATAREAEVTRKALAAIPNLGGRETRILAIAALKSYDFAQDMAYRGRDPEAERKAELDLFSNISSVPAKQIEAALGDDKKMAALVDELARKRDERPLARLAVGAAFLSLRETGFDDVVFRQLTGVTRADVRKKAEADLRAGWKALHALHPQKPAAKKKGKGA